jgi:hypothetical protein
MRRLANGEIEDMVALLNSFLLPAPLPGVGLR